MYPQMKSAIMLNVVSTASNATSTAYVDTLGFDFAHIEVIPGTTTLSATSKALTFKFSESDDTTVANATDINKLVGTTNTVTSTSAGWAIPSNPTQTQDIKAWVFNVDCRTRKRYLFLTFTPFTTQVVSAVAVLARGEIAPISAADVNALSVASA